MVLKLPSFAEIREGIQSGENSKFTVQLRTMSDPEQLLGGYAQRYQPAGGPVRTTPGRKARLHLLSCLWIRSPPGLHDIHEIHRAIPPD